VSEILNKQFGISTCPVRRFQAPARINIIGEHVDYLGGRVLPAAIDFYIDLEIRKNDKGQFRMYSRDYRALWITEEIRKSDKAPWANYILGVVDQLELLGHKIPGFDLQFGGNIPQGAGLSSSAALEVVFGYALAKLFDLPLSRKEIALIGQKAEQTFVGNQCGIMDQFVVAHGKKNHCIYLDTETLDFSYHKFELPGHEFFLIQSNVPHSLKDSEYNTRRKECESALTKLRTRYDNLLNLYSLDPNLDRTGLGITDSEELRIRHVTGERLRTQAVISSLESGDFVRTGKNLFDCHRSLSKNFEVSCEETDFLVDWLENQGILGARMIGGGFGGCILVLDRIGHLPEYQQNLTDLYRRTFGLDLEFFRFLITDGVEEIE
jgi:galactokinase